MAKFCFIIPVRHHANMRDPTAQKAMLGETIGALTKQTSDDWRLIVVANHGTDLPQLPEQASVCRVDFAPNQAHDRASLSFEEHMGVFRRDKGARVAAAIAAAGDAEFLMLLDDDDFVNVHLAADTIAADPPSGLYFDRGYMWRSGGALFYPIRKFHEKCGSCHVFRRSALEEVRSGYRDEADFVSEMLGAHIFARGKFAEAGLPLTRYDRAGGIYRVSHVGSHSVSDRGKALRGIFVGNGLSLSRPGALLRHLTGLRLRAFSGGRFGMT